MRYLKFSDRDSKYYLRLVKSRGEILSKNIYIFIGRSPSKYGIKDDNN